jgi:hypothetical protein
MLQTICDHFQLAAYQASQIYFIHVCSDTVQTISSYFQVSATLCKRAFASITFAAIPCKPALLHLRLQQYGANVLCTVIVSAILCRRFMYRFSFAGI